MSQGESSGEKTEQPTPKKERDARDKGQIARSEEVVTTISLFGTITYLWLTWDSTETRLLNLIYHVSNLYGQDFAVAGMGAVLFTITECVWILLPLAGFVIALGLLANYIQFGSVFSFDNLKPKIENIGFSKGLKRIFSAKQLVEILKSAIKIVFLSSLLYSVIVDAIPDYVNAAFCGLTCLKSVTAYYLLKVLIYTALGFLVIAVFDIAYQHHVHRKSLMMTKEEVKREYKESEGDPVIKRKRKKLAQEILLADGIERTKNATALVVNPTHFAVAIEYRPELMPLPMVVAKGSNLYAHELRAQAELAGVPIFRNVSLARSLYADTGIDEFVPDEWFGVIAEILAWVNHHRSTLYREPLAHGDIDMEKGDHRDRAGGAAPEKPVLGKYTDPPPPSDLPERFSN